MDLLIKIFYLLFITLALGELTRVQLPNNIAFTATDITVVILVLYFFISKRKKVLKTKSIHVFFALFLASCCVSLLSNAGHYPIGQVLIGSFYLIRWVFYLLIIFVVMSVDRTRVKEIKKGLLISGIISVGIGYIQYLFYNSLRPLFSLGWDEHMYRLFGAFLDPNFTSAFFILFLLLIFDHFFLKEKKFSTKEKLFFITSMIATLLAIFLTYSRSGYIMLISGSFLLFLLRRKLRWLLIILCLGLVFIIAILHNFYIENINLFRTVSTAARLETTKSALELFSKNPLFGVGFNLYRYAQISNGLRFHITTYPSHADAGTDNSFLFVLATTGVVGFTFYMLFWYEVLKEAWRRHRRAETSSLSCVVIASISGLFINALFINSLFYSFILVWVYILIGLQYVE